MKTITITIATILTLQAAILFAGNETTSAPMTNERVTITLAPSVPLEATFEDLNEVVVNIDALAPVIPSEADFSDVAPVENATLMNLAPLTPSVADFNDSIDVTTDINALARATPAAVDFE